MSETFRARVKPLVWDEYGNAYSSFGSYSILNGAVRALLVGKPVMFDSVHQAARDHDQRVRALLEIEEER